MSFFTLGNVRFISACLVCYIKRKKYVRFRILGLPFSVKKHKFNKISKFLPRKIKDILGLDENGI